MGGLLVNQRDPVVFPGLLIGHANMDATGYGGHVGVVIIVGFTPGRLTHVRPPAIDNGNKQGNREPGAPQIGRQMRQEPS